MGKRVLSLLFVDDSWKPFEGRKNKWLKVEYAYNTDMAIKMLQKKKFDAISVDYNGIGSGKMKNGLDLVKAILEKQLVPRLGFNFHTMDYSGLCSMHEEVLGWNNSRGTSYAARTCEEVWEESFLERLWQADRDVERQSVLYGDLIEFAEEGAFDVIVHGCNCFCTMGKGIAKAIRRRFPEAYEADLRTTKGARRKLGYYSKAVVSVGGKDLAIVNAYTQFRYGGKGPNLDLAAVKRVFEKINEDFAGKTVGIPQIGAGLAGGNWSVIVETIRSVTPDIDLKVVIFARGDS